MSVCTSIEDIQVATYEDTHLQKLKLYPIQAWSQHRDEVEHRMKHYWLIRSYQAITDGTAMKGRRVLIPFLL